VANVVFVAIPSTTFVVVSVLQIIALALFVTSLVLGLAIVLVSAPNRVARELANGYTSLHGSHQEVPEVAPRTNIVIREANEPFGDRVSFELAVLDAQRLHGTSEGELPA
jgi:hypothetical protein